MNCFSGFTLEDGNVQMLMHILMYETVYMYCTMNGKVKFWCNILETPNRSQGCK